MQKGVSNSHSITVEVRNTEALMLFVIPSYSLKTPCYGRIKNQSVRTALNSKHTNFQKRTILKSIAEQKSPWIVSSLAFYGSVCIIFFNVAVFFPFVAPDVLLLTLYLYTMTNHSLRWSSLRQLHLLSRPWDKPWRPQREFWMFHLFRAKDWYAMKSDMLLSVPCTLFVMSESLWIIDINYLCF